jgi:hypothetical protein
MKVIITTRELLEQDDFVREVELGMLQIVEWFEKV